MATKESGSQYNGLKFKYTNLSELRDETIYRQLKMDTQRNYLLAIFLFNIVNVFMKHYYNEIEINKPALDKEITDFKTFLSNSPYKEQIIEISKKQINVNNQYSLTYLAQHGFNKIHRMFYNIYNLYDDTFNSRIILGKLCGIILSPEQFNSIILYFFDKIYYLRDILEPYFNARSIIIKNYFPSDYPTSSSSLPNLSLKNSKGIEYDIERGDSSITYNFDEKFKSDVLSENWNDGYDFYWNETDEYQERKDKSKCERYFVQILTPDDSEIISMMIIRIPELLNKQVHFYIKRNLATQIKLFINNTKSYNNISLLIHSFATSLFDAHFVYSNLMHSMRKIFSDNGVEIDDIDYGDKMDILGNFCIRRIGHKINITEEFRNLWKKGSVVTISDTENVKIFQLKSIATQNKYYHSNNNLINKYLKYKTKYLELKKYIS